MKKVRLNLFLLISLCLMGCSKTHKIVELISAQEAKDIALAEVGSGHIVSISYDDDDRTPYYEIEILDGQNEYEFEISALDGSILKRKAKTHTLPSNLVNVDDEKAREIVLSQVEQGTIIKFKLDYDDNHPVYEATVIDSTYKYKFEISAIDGSILSQEKDLINRSNSTQTIGIDEAKAKEIALSEVPGGVITEFSSDYHKGILVYDITIVADGIEYDLEISAIDGSILSIKRDD